MKTKLVQILCLVAFTLGATLNAGAASSAGQTAVKVADAAIVRPISFTSTLVGGLLFALSLPVTAPLKKTKQTANLLVVRPAMNTFHRPLGDMDALAD